MTQGTITRPSSTDRDEDVAIIGLGCLFPGAPDIETYWQNILGKVDSITEPPGEQWTPGTYLSPDLDGDDAIYCTRGGYLGSLATFNPLEFGIMPRAVEGGEPDQWLALQIARKALTDAGYTGAPPNPERVAVILGKGTYVGRGNATMLQYGLIIDQTLQLLKTLHPELTQDDLRTVRQDLKSRLPRCDAETAGGMVPNIVAGRIANRLDLMGPSYTVDAACASSLVAADIAVRGLRHHEYDLALIGGVQLTTALPVLMMFCQLNALSRRQQIRPFDKDADGTLLSEGVGMAVLKRRGDAERDGDRIYAVIKGVGVASDGRAMGVLAPRVEGEELAIRRAYAAAAVLPSTIGLIEAHGTATPVGDVVEMEALRRVFGPRGDGLPWCGIGSVKSNIGHTMPASGMAGLIKLALSIYHKVLPPSIHVSEPNPKLEIDSTPFYINTEARPWIHGAQTTPRRAGLNAFGFGGINAHLVLEEGRYSGTAHAHMTRWDSEVCVLRRRSREELIAAVDGLEAYLDRYADANLKDVAFTVNTGRTLHVPGGSTVAIVANSAQDLLNKLRKVRPRLADLECRRVKDPSGIYFFQDTLAPGGKLAFLFPGEGAQYPNMLADLCPHFPEMRACFDESDRVFADTERGFQLSDYIFPRPSFASPERAAPDQQLWQMDVAIEAVATANQAFNTLARRLQIQPYAIVGHSTGEYSALRAARMVDEPNAPHYQRALNQLYRDALALGEGPPKATLLAVGAKREHVIPIVQAVGPGVCVAMDNCPHQVVLVVVDEALSLTLDLIRQAGWVFEVLRFDRPYHTPQFRAYASGLRDLLDRWITTTQSDPLLYSCTTAAPFPQDLTEVRRIVFEHWMQPVEFRRTIERMHDDGVSIFLEVGPRGNLTAFVDDILRDRRFIAIPMNVMRRTGITQLNHALALLTAHGVPLNLEDLYARRSPVALPLEERSTGERKKSASATTVILTTGFPLTGIGPETAARLRARLTAEWESAARSTPAADLPEPADHIDAPPPVQRVEEPNRRALPEADGVIDAYFRAMREFLVVEEQIMGANTVQSNPVDGHHMDTAPADALPFIQTVLSYVPGESLVAQCDIDVDRFPFLQSHTLGRDISVDDPTLLGLPVMPLTGSMEILAEAASLLVPELTVVGMRNVRAHRWLPVGASRRVQITARRAHGSAAVYAELREASDDMAGSRERQPATPIVEATILFASEFAEAPLAEPLRLESSVPGAWEPERLYPEAMFHGPAFQGVRSLDRVGTNGAEATLQVLDAPECGDGAARPRWITDFVLLDQPGQVVGFWTVQCLERGFLIFPYKLDELDLYGPLLSPGEVVTCRAHIQLMGEQQVRSTLEIVRDDGTVWARLVGWEDRRFDLPLSMFELMLEPSQAFVSAPWLTPLGGSSDFAAFEAFRVGAEDFPEGLLSAHGGIWRQVLACLVLSRRERAIFERLKTPESRRLEWLMGRIAAKDAVRAFITKRYGAVLCPADVEILPDSKGQPLVEGVWTQSIASVPVVSLSHATGLAVAVAGASVSHARVGVDLERVGRWAPGTERVAFTGDEQQLIAALQADEWPLRCWCAKEATAKVTGEGLVGGPHYFRIKEVNPDSGEMRVAIGKAKEATDDLVLTAFTAREGDLIVATSLRRLQEGGG